METPVVEKIYPLLYRVIKEYSKNTKISEGEVCGIVLSLAARGLNAVNLSDKEQVDAFSMVCMEFVEDYHYVKFLVPEFSTVIVNNVVASHTLFSAALRSQYGIPVSRTEGIALLSFAVKSGFIIFGQSAERIIMRYNPQKLCRLANSYFYLKRCFPNEPVHKMCLMAI